MRAFERVSRNGETLKDLAKHVEYFTTEVIYPLRETLQKADGYKKLEGILERLNKDLEEAMEPWIHFKDKKYLKKIFFSEDDKEEIQALASVVKRAIERYQLSAHARGELSLIRLEDRVSQVSQGVSYWLINALPRAVKASHTAAREDGLTSCLRGTREAILADVSKWLHDADAPAVFWLSGPAGTGKSTIAKTIAEDASQHSNIVVASFFCSTPDGGPLADPCLIIPTLAFHLARSHNYYLILFELPELGSERS
ncbi:unnamed protein product [Peniophora sp. CBMAI 1063]|nr:unnamed protein product [Peniophora sp. CBMAI 1063]